MMNPQIPTSPLVSIIVPVFNDGDTVERCVDSLRAQSWPAVEIMLVDDGSDAKTKAVLENILLESASGLSLQTHVANRGLASARNTGLAQARGEWIAFVDADDWVESGFVERLVSTALIEEAEVVNCRFALSSTGSSETSVSDEGPVELYGETLLAAPGLLNAMTLGVTNKLWARRLFDEYAIRFPAGRDFEDLAVCPQLLLQAKRITLVDEALYHYVRKESDSLMSRYGSNYLQIVASLREVTSAWQTKGVSAELAHSLLLLSLGHLLTHRISLFLRYAHATVVRAYLDAAFVYLDEWYPNWRRELKKSAGLLPKSNKLKTRLLQQILVRKNCLRLYSALLHLRFSGDSRRTDGVSV